MHNHIDSLKTWLASSPPSLPMLIGLDGFVDNLVHVVDTRTSPSAYKRIDTIAALGQRLLDAAGLSTNIELFQYDSKPGGNGPNMAAALLEYGATIFYLGAIGQGEDIHPVFRQMAAKCAAVYAIGTPGQSDALEFRDGKLILGKHSTLLDIGWPSICAALGGAQGLARTIAGCKLLAIKNWTMLPHMSDIWDKLINEVLPLLPLVTAQERPIAFFDLCDPAKRTHEDIDHAMQLLGRFETRFRVVLGLNAKELFEVSTALGLPSDNTLPENELNRALSLELYKHLDIDTLVVHPVREAFAWSQGEYYHTKGPYCASPLLTTGAGDNFNAGFCLCLAHGRHPTEALLLGAATSGFYVRNAKSPTTSQAYTFLEAWQSGKLE